MGKPPYLTDDNKIRWHSSKSVRKEWLVFGWKTVFQLRSNNGAMGRMGGGWLWKLGILYGGTDIVLELFICTLRFTRAKATP